MWSVVWRKVEPGVAWGAGRGRWAWRRDVWLETIVMQARDVAGVDYLSSAGFRSTCSMHAWVILDKHIGQDRIA
jgi:hypothetical protein